MPVLGVLLHRSIFTKRIDRSPFHFPPPKQSDQPFANAIVCMMVVELIVIVNSWYCVHLCSFECLCVCVSVFRVRAPGPCSGSMLRVRVRLCASCDSSN